MEENSNTSTLKLTFSLDEVKKFALEKLNSTDTLMPIKEGYLSQAFSFVRKDGKKCVLRISKKKQDFLKDKYAYENFFNPNLPIPMVYDIGAFGEDSFYCVSEFI